MPIFNLQTGKPEGLRTDQIEEGILSGTHSFGKKDRPIVIKDGIQYTSDPSKTKELLEAGYRLATPDQVSVDDYVKENPGITGDIKVALGQFADETLMGLPELIMDKTGDPLEVAKKEALKKEHDFANSLGGIGGFAASMAVGGPLFKGAATAGKVAERAVLNRLGEYGIKEGAESIAKNLAAKIAKNTTRLGVESAIISSPHAITEAALGDPDLAAETLILNGLGGAALGFAGTPLVEGAKFLGKLGSPIIQMGKEAIDPINAAARKAGFPAKKLANLEYIKPGLKEELPAFFKDNLKIGIATKDDEIISRLKETQSNALDVIVGKVGDDGIRSGGAMDAKNKIYGNVYNDIKLIENELKELIAKEKSSIGGDAEAKRLSTLLKEFKKNKPIAKNVSELFSGMKDISEKINYEQSFKESPNSTRILRKVRDVYRKTIDGAIDSQQGSAFYDKLKRANRDYEISATLLPFVEKKEAKDILAGPIKFKDMIMGTFGGFIGGAPGVAAAAVFSPMMSEYRDNAILLASGYMKKLGQSIDTIPQRMQKLSTVTSPIAKETSAIYAAQRAFGGDSDRADSLQKAQDIITQNQANPAMFTDNIAKQVAPLQQQAPNLANAVSFKNAMIQNYLNDNMPKSNHDLNPFNKKKWKPTDAEISKFDRKIRAIQNPMSLLDDIQNGTLTQEAVDAVKTNFPEIFKKIQEKILTTAQEMKKIPFKARAQLRMIVPEAIDQAYNNVQFYQQQYLQKNVQPQGKDVKIPSIETDVQRITQR